MTALVTVPCWIDLNAGDTAAEQAFYSGLFGWNYPEQHPDAGGWRPAMVGDAMAGGMSPRPEQMPMSFWTVFFATDDIEAAIARAVELGATVMMPPLPVVIDGVLMTTIAIVVDPTGAAFGLAQQAANPGMTHRGHGSAAWFELMTRDIDKAGNFYASLLNATIEAAPVEMDYRQIVAPGVGAFAGLMSMPAEVPEAVPAFWAPYFEVDDVDATTAAAAAAGATVLLEPHTMPAGRIAVLLDAEDAPLNLITSPAHDHA